MQEGLLGKISVGVSTINHTKSMGWVNHDEVLAELLELYCDDNEGDCLTDYIIKIDGVELPFTEPVDGMSGEEYPLSLLKVPTNSHLTISSRPEGLTEREQEESELLEAIDCFELTSTQRIRRAALRTKRWKDRECIIVDSTEEERPTLELV